MSSFFPSYLTNTSIWATVWPLVLSPIIIAFFLLLFIPKEKRAYFRMVLISISTLGMVSGFFMGLSREPAVSAIIPTILTILLGVSVVVKVKTKPYMSSLLIYVYTLSLLFSALWGAHTRNNYEEHKNSFEYLQKQIFKENELKLYEQELKE